MKTYVNKGIEYVLGESAYDNWRIIGIADPDSTWVHLSNYASCHVIIGIDKIEQEELEYARELILSKMKKAPRTAKIIYSKVKDIKRGSKVGEVIVKPECINEY
jgi:hypothetical protein